MGYALSPGPSPSAPPLHTEILKTTTGSFMDEGTTIDNVSAYESVREFEFSDSTSPNSTEKWNPATLCS